MEEFKVFVSRSFDARDRDLLEPVLRFCQAAGYRPIDTERASRSLPVDKVRDAISEARVFVGILTIDHNAGPSSRKTHDWLPTEIGMAEYAGLPVVLFLEDGVDYRPADHITSWAYFTRGDAASLWQAVVSALVELRDDSRVRWGGGSGQAEEQYRLVDDDVHITISADGVLRHERHMEVESRIPSLRALRPITKIITSSSHLGYSQGRLEFVGSPGGPRATLELRRDDPSEVSYQVNFDTPLAKGDKADFTVIHESRGSLPIVMEDLEALMQLDYVTEKPISRQGHAIKVPTDRLSIRLQFPDGYPLADCQPRVNVTLRNRVGESHQTNAELDRIRHSFKVRHNRLELEVEQPRLDHAYYLEWRPPRASDIPSGLDLKLDLPVAQ